MRDRSRLLVGLVWFAETDRLLSLSPAVFRIPVPVFGGSPSPLLHLQLQASDRGTEPNPPRGPQKAVKRPASHLGKLKPPKVAGWACDLEDLLRHHPRLQRLEFAHGQVGGVMLDQKALEAVGEEVEVDRSGVAHRVVPEKHARSLVSPQVRAGARAPGGAQAPGGAPRPPGWSCS